ncbi:MAG: amidohydrolase [Alistipes sp.]|nr:amidohydrolase [Alistipes sp.]
MSRTLIKDCVVVPVTAPGFFTGSVGVEGGRIVLVADNAREEDRRRVEEFRTAAARGPGSCPPREMDGRGKLLMPGLVNTHTHVAMTLMRNMADDLPLMAWLRERVWPFESRLTPGDITVGARLGMAEMLLSGTTTLIDMYWHEAAVARAARETGIRALLCPSFIDGERMSGFERDLDETLAAAEGVETLTVRPAPHAAYSCSAENLRRAVDLARRHNLGITIHVSETLDEQRMIRERHGCTPTEYLRDAGVFSVPAIAAHCVHVTDGDIEILRTNGVTVAHNPQSNMKLASGAAPVARMLDAGVNVTIGTDGASSNNDLDMWDEMRSASLLGKLTAADPAVMPAWEVVKMATAAGARAIGMEGRLGIVAEGAIADLILVDTQKPHWYPHNNPVSALVYSARASDVHTVWVNGREVVSGGRLTSLDTDALMRDVQRCVASTCVSP